MKCKICSENFDTSLLLIGHLKRIHKLCSQDYYNRFLKRHDEGYCLQCNNPTSFICFSKGYAVYCSAKCSANSKEVREKAKVSCIEKYGVENVSQSKDIKTKKIESMKQHFGMSHHLMLNSQKIKQKQTCIEKYGVENVSQDSSIQHKKALTCIEHFSVDNAFKASQIKEKIKNTNLEKYGTSSHTQNKQYKNNIKQQIFEKYGVSSHTQREEVKSKTKQTCLKKYGAENPSNCAEINDKKRLTLLLKFLPIMKQYLNRLNLEIQEEYHNSHTPLPLKCLKCNTIFQESLFNVKQGCGRCPTCFSKRAHSIKETELYNFISSLGFEVIKNSRKIIAPYELDIYIPDKQIGIEYNGLYWHSEKYRAKTYHLDKVNQCNAKGIRLIQVFEDEYVYKQNIVEARLSQILGKYSPRIHARKCTIHEISADDKDKFLNTYHMQGSDISKVRLGAYHDNELIAVMTFSKGNIAKGSTAKDLVWELNRFCTHFAYHIPGIASKLLCFFKRNWIYTEIFSYADRRWSEGGVYYKLGFKLDSKTPPNYWYIKNCKRIHRFNLRKTADDPQEIPEWVLRAEQGYFRVWDSGHLKFKLTG
jgi:hypothetical protein